MRDCGGETWHLEIIFGDTAAAAAAAADRQVRHFPASLLAGEQERGARIGAHKKGSAGAPKKKKKEKEGMSHAICCIRVF